MRLPPSNKGSGGPATGAADGLALPESNATGALAAEGQRCNGRWARPLIPLLAAFGCGILSAQSVPGQPFVAGIAAAAAAAGLIHGLARQRNARLAPLVLFCALGYLALHPWTAPTFPPNHVRHFTNGKKWLITGRVVSPPDRRSYRTRFLLAAESLAESDGAPFAVVGRVRVTIAGEPVQLDRGDRIRMNGSLRPFRNFENPGGFDYRRYMAYQNTWCSTYSSTKTLTLVEKGAAGFFAKRVDDWRRQVSQCIERAAAGDTQAVLKALVVGDRSSVSDAAQEGFLRAGIGHLLAISGLHIGIVASAAFFVFTRFFSFFPPLLWRGRVRSWAAAWAFLPAASYALLAGMSPSTQRAIIMVGVFLSTFLLKRDQDLVNSLAVAALVILAVHPPALFSISFQLSFTAVLAIVWTLNARGPARRVEGGGWVRRRLHALGVFVLVSLAATLGTLPLSLLYFNRLSLVGVPANCLLVPWIGFGVVPAALLAVFLLPISPAAALLVMQAAATVLSPALQLIRWLSALPFAAVHTVTPNWLEVGCYYLLAVLLLFRLRVPKQGGPSLPAGRPRRRTGMPAASGEPGTAARRPGAVLAALAAVLLIAAADAGYWLYERFGRSDLRVTVLDVGQGSAALLELPGGRCMLVDGGGFADNTAFDVGRQIVAPFLWRKKIASVQTLVLSHANSDHLNGLVYIADRFHVQQIWSNGEPSDTVGYRQLMAVADKRGIRRHSYADLPKRVVCNGVEFCILYPPDGFLAKRRQEPWRDINNNSLVLKAVLGERSFLFPGDIGARAEAELSALAGDRLKSTVCLVPHHGSRWSNTLQFVEAVQPEIAVVSSGWRNRFNLPHPAVLDRYRRNRIRVLRTDLDGAVTFVTDGRRLSVVTRRERADVKAAARPDRHLDPT